MDIKALVKEHREQILALAHKHGAMNVRVSGSLARGETHGHSDLDLLVDMEEGRSLFDLGGLVWELRQLLRCPVDVVTEKGLNERMRPRVLRDALPL